MPEAIFISLFVGVILGYAFRGRENFLIRLTVNEAIAEWTKAKQMIGQANQAMKSEAGQIAKKL